MRRQAAARLERHGLSGVVDLDSRPYGSHAGYEGEVDAVLFSYSLSMIPPFEEVLERARLDLRPGGRIAVVDFLDAWGPVDLGLRRSHVHLGPIACAPSVVSSPATTRRSARSASGRTSSSQAPAAPDEQGSVTGSLAGACPSPRAP